MPCCPRHRCPVSISRIPKRPILRSARSARIRLPILRSAPAARKRRRGACSRQASRKKEPAAQRAGGYSPVFDIHLASTRSGRLEMTGAAASSAAPIARYAARNLEAWMKDDAIAPDDPSSAVERRLATILMADVFGYSRLMGEDEERTVRTFRGHRAVFDELVKVHRGRVFNTAGDAILAEFPSAVEAVRCAV